MKIYMMTDLEGVAGVVDFEDRETDTHHNHHTRRRMQQLLTAEVNAAVDGLYAAGATEVIVNDGHGAGFTIDVEDLDTRAQIVHGFQRPHWLPLLDETCDATVLVGAHAKAGTIAGDCYHTMSKQVKEWSINGVSLGEMGLQALIAGAHGVPMIYVSGDCHACREIEALIPGITTTAVKKGLSRRSAVSWPPARARQMIHADAEQALRRLDQVRPLVFETPLVLREELFTEAYAGRTSSNPDVVYLDANRREIHAADIHDLLGKLYGYDLSWRETSLGPGV